MNTMSVSPIAPASQVMSKDDVEKKILNVEVQPGRRVRNVCGVLAAAVYGLLGCPVCCCFCCGCGGKFPAAPMVPSDVKGDVGKMSREDRAMFNVESHLMALVLGCSPASWCTACMCCGACGSCGPHGAAKLATLVGSEKR